MDYRFSFLRIFLQLKKSEAMYILSGAVNFLFSNQNHWVKYTAAAASLALVQKSEDIDKWKQK